ncbi:unnamed protein product [Linum tenue]|uniref:Cytochrome P450 n=1 Tax=Linum tenue TaxID=586396 RepID=A0AAV0Q5L7_9ROSI|nr:unnamed protein product [Linum tenue]
MKRISLTELLGPRKTLSFRGIRETEVSGFIQSLRNCAGKPVNITEKLLNLTNRITTKAAFGYQCVDEDEFVGLVNSAVKAASGFNVGDLYPSLGFLQDLTGMKSELLRTRNGLDLIFAKIIKQHQEKRVNGGSDVESGFRGLVAFKCPITSTNIKAVLVDLFIAGTDTSSITMEWAMSEMMKNPIVMRKAQPEVREAMKGKSIVTEADIQNLPYLDLAIKETFRLHPPIPLLFPRESKERCEIAGYEIAKKTKVIVNAWAIGRDPGAWEEPEHFIPERFDGSEIDFKGMHFELLPFRAGRRICPGIALGMANVELPLAQLLYYFDWELPGGLIAEKFNMEESFGATMRRKNPLYLVAKEVDSN